MAKKTKKKAKQVQAVEVAVEKDFGVPPIEIQLDLDRTEVARRAYHRFVQRGGSHGHAFEDWLAAEAEVRGEISPRPETRA
jgi:hypothetical protein